MLYNFNNTRKQHRLKLVWHFTYRSAASILSKLWKQK